MAIIMVKTDGDKVNLVNPSDHTVSIQSRGHLLVVNSDSPNPGKVSLKLKSGAPGSCDWLKTDLADTINHIYQARAPFAWQTMICDYSIQVENVEALDPRVIVEPPNYFPVIVNVDGSGHDQVHAKPGLEPPGSSMLVVGGALAVFVLALLVGYLLGKTKR